jgi:hypothetical protein
MEKNEKLNNQTAFSRASADCNGFPSEALELKRIVLVLHTERRTTHTWSNEHELGTTNKGFMSDEL